MQQRLHLLNKLFCQMSNNFLLYFFVRLLSDSCPKSRGVRDIKMSIYSERKEYLSKLLFVWYVSDLTMYFLFCIKTRLICFRGPCGKNTTCPVCEERHSQFWLWFISLEAERMVTKLLYATMCSHELDVKPWIISWRTSGRANLSFFFYHMAFLNGSMLQTFFDTQFHFDY